MPTLHLQVCAGFANRIRALVSGICFAEAYGLTLVIHWFPKSPECVCRFGSVIDAETLPKTVKVVPEDMYTAKEVLSQEECMRTYLAWDKQSDLFWKSYSIFYFDETWISNLRAIKPSRLVKEFLERRCNQVDWSTAIGVHIRRTDNTKSIQHSPLTSFLQKMRENKKASYVIATDDKEVRDELTAEFGDHCVFPAMILTRKTEEGMIQGVADFFALSKCSKLWGSYASSFSEIAARYGSIQLTVV